MRVPHPHDELCQKTESGVMRICGPAIATDPSGGVWCSLLGGDGALVRIDPTTGEKALHLLPKARQGCSPPPAPDPRSSAPSPSPGVRARPF